MDALQSLGRPSTGLADLILTLKLISAATWIIMLLLLLPPLWRCLGRRGRLLDPLWAAMIGGTVNRLMFVSGAVPLVVSYVAAILQAVLMLLVIRSYQRADR